MVLTPASKTTLTESAIERIIELLRSDGLVPGDQLPSERELRVSLGVGRTCVREALQALAAAKIIEVRAGRGAFVLAANPTVQLEQAVLATRVQRERLLDLLELREVVEMDAAGKAAQRVTPADVVALEKALAEERDAIQAGKPFAPSDLAFHRAVARATHNSVFPRVIESMAGLLLDSMEKTQLAAPDPVPTYQIHREIFEAIRDCDVERARAAMQRHLARSRRILESLENP